MDKTEGVPVNNQSERHSERGRLQADSRLQADNKSEPASGEQIIAGKVAISLPEHTQPTHRARLSLAQPGHDGLVSVRSSDHRDRHDRHDRHDRCVKSQWRNCKFKLVDMKMLLFLGIVAPKSINQDYACARVESNAPFGS